MEDDYERRDPAVERTKKYSLAVLTGRRTIEERERWFYFDEKVVKELEKEKNRMRGKKEDVSGTETASSSESE